MLATDGKWHEVDSADDAWRAIERPALVATLVLMLVVGAFLLARRISGAIDAPLAPLPLAATATALLLWALTLRLRLRFAAYTWLPLIAIALIAVACSYPGARWFDWVVWLAVIAAYWFTPARHSPPAGEQNTVADLVLQQLSRSRTAEGNDAFHGTLVAEFAPGERSATLHVAFCPPFEQLPQVDAEAIDSEACEVKVAQILHQGARLEVRLARASTAAHRVTIEFAATAEPPLAV